MIHNMVFVKKRSTEQALLGMINQIINKTNMDGKLYSCGIFLDLRKVQRPLSFDKVDHQILLNKLHH